VLALSLDGVDPFGLQNLVPSSRTVFFRTNSPATTELPSFMDFDPGGDSSLRGQVIRKVPCEVPKPPLNPFLFFQCSR